MLLKVLDVGDDFVVRYYDHVFPVRPSTYRLASHLAGGERAGGHGGGRNG